MARKTGRGARPEPSSAPLLSAATVLAREQGASGGCFLPSTVCLLLWGLGGGQCPGPESLEGKMKLSRQFTVFGSAIFCVVIFSLYLMLDRGHLDYPKNQRREGSFPQVSAGTGGARGCERGGAGGGGC